jgi:hypothetical protein
MQNFDQIEFASPLAVVAHDAGAANLIIGWLRCQKKIEVRTCLSGPAIDLWSAAFGKPSIMDLDKVLSGARAMLTGTSYDSNLEHFARISAKKCGVFSIAVIDHWVNYPERFQRGGVTQLPDEIWVTDRYALDIAQGFFPETVVHQKPNLYLNDLVKKIRIAESQLQKKSGVRVLYVLEPLRHLSADGGVAGEFQALDYFIENCRKIGLDETAEIRLRPHPSDPPCKYDSWIADHADWNLKVELSDGLVQLISWADTVVGCETYALAVGVAANRRVISTLPPGAPACRLPMHSIIHLRDISVSISLSES